MAILDIRKPQQNEIKHYLGDPPKMALIVTDHNDIAVDLSGKDLVFSIKITEFVDNEPVVKAIATLTTADDEITVGGTGNNVLTFNKAIPELTQRSYQYDLKNTTDNETITVGTFVCTYEGR